MLPSNGNVFANRMKASTSYGGICGEQIYFAEARRTAIGNLIVHSFGQLGGDASNTVITDRLNIFNSLRLLLEKYTLTSPGRGSFQREAEKVSNTN